MTATQRQPHRPYTGLIAAVSVGLALLIGGGLFAVAFFAGVATPTATAIGVVSGLIVCVGMLLWGWFVRVQARRKAVWLGVWQSSTTGTVPDDAKPSEWIPRLRSRRSFWKFFRVTAPIEFAFFTTLGVVAVVSEPGTWWGWAELVFFPVSGVFGFWQAGRALERIDNNLETLQQRQQGAG